MRIAFAIGMLMLIGALPTAAAPANPPADPTLARLAGLNGNAFDVAFMQSVIPVDQESIELAMTATLYADHPELLHWNQTVVERKNDQVRKMMAWLQAAGAAPAEQHSGEATSAVKKLRTLRGAALERTYLQLMVNQLDEVSAMARLAAVKTQQPELRDFARQTVRAETQDSTTLRGWMKQWYSIQGTEPSEMPGSAQAAAVLQISAKFPRHSRNWLSLHPLAGRLGG